MNYQLFFHQLVDNLLAKSFSFIILIIICIPFGLITGIFSGVKNEKAK